MSRIHLAFQTSSRRCISLLSSSTSGCPCLVEKGQVGELQQAALVLFLARMSVLITVAHLLVLRRENSGCATRPMPIGF